MAAPRAGLPPPPATARRPPPAAQLRTAAKVERSGKPTLRNRSLRLVTDSGRGGGALFESRRGGGWKRPRPRRWGRLRLLRRSTSRTSSVGALRTRRRLPRRAATSACLR
eukprot:357838-Chlamydomonas_euryale.AAC.5